MLVRHRREWIQTVNRPDDRSQLTGLVYVDIAALQGEAAHPYPRGHQDYSCSILKIDSLLKAKSNVNEDHRIRTITRWIGWTSAAYGVINC